MPDTLGRKALAEFIGTALLFIAVIGSGIAAQRLSPHDTGLELLENAAATAAALVAIILAVGAVSGAHLNPVVTLADWLFGGVQARETAVYVAAQLTGAAAGAVVANLMFSLPAVELSTHQRSSAGLWLGEVVATFGLLLVIFATFFVLWVLWIIGNVAEVPFLIHLYPNHYDTYLLHPRIEETLKGFGGCAADTGFSPPWAGSQGRAHSAIWRALSSSSWSNSCR